MRHRVGRLLIAWSVVCFGGVALSGAGLHALPGCDHHVHGADLDAQSRHGHHGEQPAPVHDDCPICQLAEGAGLTIASTDAPRSLAVAPSPAEPLAPALCSSTAGLHSPRAPPSAGSTRVA